VPEGKPTILIVEDDTDVAEMLAAFFKMQGYHIAAANDGEEAVQSCMNRSPGAIILDIGLPGIDGYEVARRLRSNRKTEEIPIIFLTEKRARDDRLQGLEIGADGYITKPFDIQELRLRVSNALRRAEQGSLTNPVTGLPEGVLVEERLRACLHNDRWALLMIVLEHLDQFREANGFVAASDVQRVVSTIIQNGVRSVGSPGDFVGHLGQNTFLVITQPAYLPELVERIQTRLDQALEYITPFKDRSQENTTAVRLNIWISRLLPGDGPFPSPDAIKDGLSNHRICG
jgi:DNA-binding response OmpR family regulator